MILVTLPIFCGCSVSGQVRVDGGALATPTGKRCVSSLSPSARGGRGPRRLGCRSCTVESDGGPHDARASDRRQGGFYPTGDVSSLASCGV